MYDLEPLEFFELLGLVASFAESDLGKKAVLSLRPAGLKEARARFEEVKEAVLFCDLEGGLSLSELEDISPLVEVAKVKGAVLSADNILLVKRQLFLAGEVKRRFDPERYPALSRLAGNIASLRELISEIDASIDVHGEVKDDATDELRSIRSSIRAVRAEITERLKRFIGSSFASKVLSDTNIHLRNDRFVLAVRAEKVSQVKGIVVDSSSTGRTVFVEPSFVVPLNNKLALLREREKREIERVLRRLTEAIGRHAASIAENQRVLAYLDSVFARARFARKYNASVPQIGEERRISIVRGRHPLLYKLKGGDTVPLDLEMGRNFTTLVITGPNTGGKTVALKTIGLLTLMALSGIPVTAHGDSYFFAFSKVMADIGDEQDIESSLSTFSSHIERIKRIVEEADRDSLVLIDELGTGTDPEEGSALAVAIAEYLHKRGSFNVITTHHGELKLLAYATQGMENASVEFDVESLKPTYRLLVGIPGESNAFIIAERLGLRKEIVERAKKVKGSSAEDKGEAVSWVLKAKREAELLLKEAQELKGRASEELERAKRDAERIREEAFEEVNRIIDEAKRSIKSASSRGEGAVVRVAREIKRKVKEKVEEEKREAIRVGDIVEVPSFGIEGRVVAVRGSNVEVHTGKMSLTVPIASVKPTGRKAQEEKRETPSISLKIERSRDTFFPELNIVGKRVDDALPEVEKFLNDGYLLGIKNLRIIHGKGEGILKQAVQEFLKDHPLVASFRLADEREGGSGVTLVELLI